MRKTNLQPIETILAIRFNQQGSKGVGCINRPRQEETVKTVRRHRGVTEKKGQ